MLKERPYELNQKLKRVQASRDDLKSNNREKSLQNKKLRDRNAEITQSRDMWKSRNKELEKALERHKEDLILQIETTNKAIEEERKRTEKERERADFLQAEIEDIKKKSRP
jgi:DNA repair exonuclease SbcCD ATPase subunit